MINYEVEFQVGYDEIPKATYHRSERDSENKHRFQVMSKAPQSIGEDRHDSTREHDDACERPLLTVKTEKDLTYMLR